MKHNEILIKAAELALKSDVHKKYGCIITYKNDIKSNIKFIIEMENGSIYDFYMLITSADVTNDENKKTEINKFAKDEALSFLSRLNLYR